MDANPRLDVPLLPSAIAASVILSCSCATNSLATWAFRKVLGKLRGQSHQKKLGLSAQQFLNATI
jgi:hypothetical protein